jgi:DNA-binding NarL/FixJ family response regulator
MKVLIVDDHALFRAGLRMLIQSVAADMVVFEATLIDEAIVQVECNMDMRLCFLDIHLSDKNGLDLVSRLKLAAPGIAVVVVSADDSYQAVLDSLDAGAMAYIPKRSSAQELTLAVTRVLRGEVYLPPGIGPAPHASHAAQPRFPSMSKRQWDVFHCLMRGLPNKLICRELDLSDNTVKSHLHAIYRAFNVNTRTSLLLAASRIPHRPASGDGAGTLQ